MASQYQTEADYRAPVQPSLSRVILAAGGERELMICLYLFGLDITLKCLSNWRLMVPTILLVALGHWGLVRLAKFDPQWRSVFLRHMRYKSHYHASVHPCQPKRKARPSLPPMRELS